MEYVVVALTAWFAATLTFFSGFGLGTVLLPAFALFFPAQVAVGLTAVVHLCNNLFKLALIGKHARLKVVLQFGSAAIVASYFGAMLLFTMAALPVMAEYHLLGRLCVVTPVKLTIGLLMVGFAVVEVYKPRSRARASAGFLWFGGLLSGFFGGLSGHQGAFRSIFLLQTGMTKEAFVATGVVVATVVDVVRLLVYSRRLDLGVLQAQQGILWTAIGAAFLGALVGRRLLKKMTLSGVRWVVAALLALIGAGLAAGVM